MVKCQIQSKHLIEYKTNYNNDEWLHVLEYITGITAQSVILVDLCQSTGEPKSWRNKIWILIYFKSTFRCFEHNREIKTKVKQRLIQHAKIKWKIIQYLVNILKWQLQVCGTKPIQRRWINCKVLQNSNSTIALSEIFVDDNAKYFQIYANYKLYTTNAVLSVFFNCYFIFSLK